MPEPGWIEAVERFIERADPLEAARAPPCSAPHELAELPASAACRDCWLCMRAHLGGGPKPDQGLLIARRFYDAIGGHRAATDAEAALLRRLGRRRIAMLPAAASAAR